MDYGVSFWDRVAERYAKSSISNNDRYQQKLAATQRYLLNDMDVFEFGCGTGSTAIHHAPHVNSYLATDLSSKMLSIAQHKQEVEKLSNLTFEQMAIEEWPEEGGKYDVIFGLSILHLLDDPDMVIKKTHRMLKPNGLFITSTACITDSMPLLRFIAPIGGFLGLIPKIKFFTNIEIERRINSAGFETEFSLPNPDKSEACFLISTKIN